MTLRIIYGRIRIALQSRRLLAGLCRFQRVGFSVVVLGFSATLVAAEPAKRVFHIEAKPATQSLTDYAQQAHTQLGYDVEIVENILTNAVVGEYDPAEALKLLLEDTGLEAEYGQRGIFIRRIAKRDVGGNIAELAPPFAEANSLRFGLTSGAEMQASVGRNPTSQRTEPDSDRNEERRPLEEIIVTGTNIRGLPPESSPMRIFTREDIQISGAATAQDFIRLMPQNFGGGSNTIVPQGLPNDVNVLENNGGQGGRGSGVNLRGLGSGSTLVLLNGHRLAPSSGVGDFVDISMIPSSAIERVEILTDGASSIYGGDAVAGVVNFILREDFDGAETSLRYGTVMDGDLNEYRASVTGGESWNAGGGLITYDYFTRDDLSAADRSFSQDLTIPHDLLPSEERHSVLATASQNVTSEFGLNADLLFSRRKAVQDRTQFLDGDSVRAAPTSKILNIAAGGTWNINNDWVSDFSATYSDVRINVLQTGDFENIRRIDSGLWTADIKASGDLLTLPSGNVKLALGGHYREDDFSNFNIVTENMDREADRNVYAFFGEAFIPIVGPGNALPGIERLEINLSSRYERYSDFGSTVNPKVGFLWSPVESLRLRGSYSTSFKPPPLGRVGAADFAVNAFPTSLLNEIFGVEPSDPSIADVIQLVMTGTDKSLDAEYSRTFTAGVDFERQWARHSFAFATTWFDTRFEQRLGQTPMPSNLSPFIAYNIAFDNPDAFPAGTVIFSPTADQISETVDNADVLFTRFGDPFAAEILNFAPVIRNLARTVTSGLDVDLLYSFEIGRGTFLLGADATYLIDFQQQGAATTPLIEALNTLYSPVDLNLRGRIGYSHDRFSGNLFVNYTDSYTVDSTTGSMPIDSWTTVDLSLSYDIGEASDNALLNNTISRLSIVNMFNEAPPSTPSSDLFELAGYDPANASPLGGFVAVELTKKF